MEQVFLAYGPLGVMVLGLGTVVVYLWKQLMASHAAEKALLRESLETETEMSIKYLELCIQLNHSLELLTEKIGNGTDFRVKS